MTTEKMVTTDSAGWGGSPTFRTRDIRAASRLWSLSKDLTGVRYLQPGERWG